MGTLLFVILNLFLISIYFVPPLSKRLTGNNLSFFVIFIISTPLILGVLYFGVPIGGGLFLKPFFALFIPLVVEIISAVVSHWRTK